MKQVKNVLIDWTNSHFLSSFALFPICGLLSSSSGQNGTPSPMSFWLAQLMATAGCGRSLVENAKPFKGQIVRLHVAMSSLMVRSIVFDVRIASGMGLPQSFALLNPSSISFHNEKQHGVGFWGEFWYRGGKVLGPL